MKVKAVDLDKRIGAQLRAAREARGLSMVELQKAGGVSVTWQQIQKYENGSNQISVSMLAKLLMALNVTPGDFFDGLIDQKTTGDGRPRTDVLELVRAYNALPTDAARAYARTSLRHLAQIATGTGQ